MALNPGPYLKAIVAGTLAGLGTLYTALADGHVSQQEAVQVAIITISAAAAIYGVPNTPTPTRTSTPVPDPGPGYLPPAPATQWPAGAIARATTPLMPPAATADAADTAALAAAAAARNGAGA